MGEVRREEVDEGREDEESREETILNERQESIEVVLGLQLAWSEAGKKQWGGRNGGARADE